MSFFVYVCGDEIGIVDVAIPKLAYLNDLAIRNKLLRNWCVNVQVIISQLSKEYWRLYPRCADGKMGYPFLGRFLCQMIFKHVQSIPSAFSLRMPFRRPIRVIQDSPWEPPRWLIPCGRVTCATIRVIPNGRDVIDSSFRG